MTLDPYQKVTETKGTKLLLIHPNDSRPDAGLAECFDAAKGIIRKLFRFTTEVIEPLAELVCFSILTKERSFRHDRDNAAGGSKLIERMANVFDVRTVFKGRIHDDAIVLAVMFQEVFAFDLVAFGFEHIEQCAVDLNGRYCSVGMLRAKHVEDIPFAGGWF